MVMRTGFTTTIAAGSLTRYLSACLRTGLDTHPNIQCTSGHRRHRPAGVSSCGRPLLAIVAQRYDGDIHCIVVHDQEEPDTSLEELARDGRTVTTTINKGRPGLAAARNAGLDLVRTDIIASCDDDDTWLPDKIRLQVERLLAHPKMLVVGGGINLLMPEDRVVEWLGPCDLVTQSDLFRSRRKELHSSTLLMRRKAFDLAGGYDENLPRATRKTTRMAAARQPLRLHRRRAQPSREHQEGRPVLVPRASRGRGRGARVLAADPS